MFKTNKALRKSSSLASQKVNRSTWEMILYDFLKRIVYEHIFQYKVIIYVQVAETVFVMFQKTTTLKLVK